MPGFGRARVANPAQRKPLLELMRPRANASDSYKRSVVRMKFLGAKSSTPVSGLDELEANDRFFRRKIALQRIAHVVRKTTKKRHCFAKEAVFCSR